MSKSTSKPLHYMFTAVPPRYDLINCVITLGIDRRWRRLAAESCLDSSPKRILDLCCGTADLSVGIARKAGDKVKIVGLDYSQPMLDIAQRKAGRLASKDITFILGDASSLPFPDEYFDCVGISFAFRNLTFHNPLTGRVLKEVVRVLKTGRKFVIVESSQPESKLIKRLFHIYLRAFAKNAGHLISGNSGAYKYLAESASRFYTPSEVRELLLTAGFNRVTYRPLLFGAAGIHVAVK